jgi:hypothetical protein
VQTHLHVDQINITIVFLLHREETMGITAIKRITNNFTSSVTVSNSENPDKPKNGGTVASRRSIEVDMWIPWATKESDLDDHSITVTLSRGRPAKVYQGALLDGDFVRVIPPGGTFPGHHIGGPARVDGDRHMRISRSGKISVEII